MVNRAIKNGVLIKPSVCENCGKECSPEGHHEDYSMPLEVVWLCKSCHLELHKVKGNYRKTNNSHTCNDDKKSINIYVSNKLKDAMTKTAASCGFRATTWVRMLILRELKEIEKEETN